MKALLMLLLLTSSVLAAEIEPDTAPAPFDFAQVSYVSVSQQYDGSWCFNTSVRHNDEGWEHYADGWDILDTNGNQLWERPLAHPHVNEQPFTRRLCDIQIPPEITKLVVRAKCNKHSYGDKTITVDLTKTTGIGYEIKRFD